MKVYPSEKIRNVGIVAHQGAGKTSLTEAMIFNTGAITRLGKVEDGNTVADYHPEELKRKSTVNTSLVACEWRDNKINVIDTPGFSDFFAEVVSTLRVADSLVMVIDANGGVEVTTEIIWEMADDQQIPMLAFVNKLDRENADFYKALEDMQEKARSFSQTRQVVPIQLPIGKEASFEGVVDLINLKAYKYEKGKAVEIPIPGDIDVDTYREMLVEAAAEGDDEIMEKFLDTMELTTEELIIGLKGGIKQAKLVPVLAGSATNNIAVDKLMDILIDYTPSPLYKLDAAAANAAPAALIFKTMADQFVGRISMFKVMSGKMKSDTLMYNANKGVEEKVAQLSTMQGKNSINLPEFTLGDIGTVAKLAATVTGDTLTTKDSGIMLDGIDFPEPNLTVAIVAKT